MSLERAALCTSADRTGRQLAEPRPGPGAGWLLRALLGAALLGLSAPLAAQTGTLVGQVDDARTGRAIVEAAVRVPGTVHATLTDEDGRFRITGLRPGNYTLIVAHIAYGSGQSTVRILEGEATTVRILLSDSAIVLEPITVDVLSREERDARSAGYRRSVVTRAQLALAENTNMTMADALRSYAPSVRVRSAGNLVGMPICIELRSVRATFRNNCLSPAVYLDGVPITNPTTLYNNLDVRLIESIEVVPSAEAGARYGTGALFGALLIETIRPGVPGAETGNPLPERRSPRFDWALDPTTHPSSRSFLYSFLGNAVGLALGITAADQCITTRQPSHDRIVSTCGSGATLASATAALVLPALGGGIGSWLGGATPLSKGKLFPGVIGGAMALLPAYGLLFSAKRMDSDVIRGIGIAVLVVGVPVVSTFADHQFRYLREDVPPPPF